MTNLQNNRTCSHCNLSLSSSSFYSPKADKYSFLHWCKTCIKVNREKILQERKKRDYLKHLYSICLKKRHKKYSGSLIEFEYLNAMWERQAGLCYWTKLPMIRQYQNQDALLVSVDRLDNTLGYIKGNVVLCCHFVNIAKSTQTTDEFNSYIQNFNNLIGSIVKQPLDW